MLERLLSEVVVERSVWAGAANTATPTMISIWIKESQKGPSQLIIHFEVGDRHFVQDLVSLVLNK